MSDSLKVCAHCWRFTPCPVHLKSAQWRSQSQEYTRVRGRRLQRMREELFLDEPFCRACKVKVAEIRDHIIPLAEGGTDERENTQPLCLTCSDEKTEKESARGRARSRM